ncbi:MAG TPA: extracellular solute-binding protein, partial [Devosia sp.]|nr:extracellular solute-binding protein [Devosia sp.]
MSLQWLKIAAVSSVAALALSSAAYAQTVRVTVAEYSSKTGPYFEKAATEFEAANPGTDIQIEVVPWDVLQQKLTTDISGNANADLAIIGTRWLIDYVSEGVAAPLDSYITPDFKARFIDTFLSPSVMDGATYGLPIAASARAMYYNKTLFEQAGIAEPPKNWDEVAAAAEKIKALGGDSYGFGLQGKEIETDVYFYYAFWSQGGDLIDADG